MIGVNVAWVARARLVTGLVLFTYLTTHLLNHALGLVSLAAMDAGRQWFLLLWRNPAGTVALYGSLVTHVTLAFWSLYRRRTLRMPRWEATQLVLGLCIPPLLAGHIVGNRLAHEWFGVDDTYTRLVLIMWHLNPFVGWKQTVVLVIAWLHGAIGLHFWLRLRPWYGQAVPAVLAAALLVPTLALLGFVAAGREVDPARDRAPRLGADRAARVRDHAGAERGAETSRPLDRRRLPGRPGGRRCSRAAPGGCA